MKKLFPEDLVKQIKHNQSTANPSPTVTPARVEKVEKWRLGYTTETGTVDIPYYFLPPEKVTDKLVACGLFDWRGGSDASKEKIYFKSEVVVRDEDYGWVMWNGLSSNPSDTSKKVDFEYRLLTFMKKGNKWEIDRGFGWSTPVSSNNNAQDQLKVAIPKGHPWKIVDNNADEGYSERKIWSGIAKPDGSVDQHLVKSLEVYMYSKNAGQNSAAGVNYNAEFFGLNGGKWMDGNGTRGYSQANKMYVKDKGWQTLSPTIDLRDTLNTWYYPFVSKKIGWSTCDKWVSGRNMTSWDETMKEMCYSQTASR